LAGGQTDRQADRQAGGQRETGRRTERDRQADSEQAGGQTDRKAARQAIGGQTDVKTSKKKFYDKRFKKFISTNCKFFFFFSMFFDCVPCNRKFLETKNISEIPINEVAEWRKSNLGPQLQFPHFFESTNPQSFCPTSINVPKFPKM
jgi:hypothetical protein